ncbi:MAG: autotransporter outer membrane beta-barrel domain-containing protein, partial [Alphaproteobacteria bacterium]|nr:autotransporter outer membrane beta-barrel domain-containing protein [Alphaproteobacteria bacterium]
IRPLYTIRDQTGLARILAQRTTAFASEAERLGTVPRQLASLGGGQTAAAGGPRPRPWQLWFSASYGNFDNDHTATDHSGDLFTGTVGLDRKFGKGHTVGVSLARDRMDLATRFNFGDYESDSVTIAPYGAVQLTDWLELSAMVAYTHLDIEQSRQLVVGLGDIESSTESRRWLGQVSATATTVLRSWYLSGRLGVVYSDEKIDGFTESNGNVVEERNIHLGQLQAEGRVGKFFDGGVVTVGATYIYDVNPMDFSVGFGQPEPDDDRDGAMANAGLTFFHGPGVMTNFAVSHEFSRNYVSNTFATATLILRF